MKNLLFATLLQLAITQAHAVPLPNLEFDLRDSKVDFLSVGRPAAIKIRGEGSKLQGKLTVVNDMASGVLVFDLDSLDTNIDLRNHHMKEKYLETNKYKNAELTINKLKIPDQVFLANAKSIALPFEGVLSLHGVQRAIIGTSTLQIKNNHITGEAAFDLKLSDYKIEIPKYLGITVADVVKISVNFNADEKALK